MALRNKGTVVSPLIELTVHGGSPLDGKVMEDIADEVRWRYDLDSREISSFVRKFRTDRLLGPVIRKWRGTRPKSGYSLYEYLVITVMLQNTVVRRSVQMLQNLFETYGRLIKFDGKRLWSFWRPEDIHCAGEEELRELKVGYRARTLKRQAAQFVSGEIDPREWRKLKGDALLQKLDGIYGVGPQSAGYLCSEFFHDYDMMKSVSPWDAKIYSHLVFGHGDASPKRILEFLDRNYSGFRALAIEYLLTDVSWRNKESGVGWLQKLIRL
jgi:3-methyladenine DNA glycosylase/8-oxoguanine DNA glycosylase